MSSHTKFNALTVTVAATLAMSLAAPSWAGERGHLNPPAAGGGMGFGPMPLVLVDAVRPAKPIRGEEAAPSMRGPEMIAAKDLLPTAPSPQSLPLSVAGEVAPTVVAFKTRY